MIERFTNKQIDILVVCLWLMTELVIAHDVYLTKNSFIADDVYLPRVSLYKISPSRCGCVHLL